MKFPSINTLLKNIVSSFSRFPLAILISIFGTCIAIYLTELDFFSDQKQTDLYIRLLLTSILGLSLFIFLNLISESKAKGNKLKIISNVLGVLLLAGFFFMLPEKMNLLYGYRFALFFIAIHCFVSFAPFVRKGQTNGFWQFNKSLFLHFLVSALYSAVLYIGIALAMLAVENLFDASIKTERYFQLWIIIVGIFNSWFFIAGIPKNFVQFNKESKYPKGLKVFTQWILLPLVLLYLIILYVYSGKIIAFGNWPSGWVAYLVLGFSIIGIFSLLLVYPIKDEKSNKWIRIFTKFFYWALLPLIILLFVAIWKRVSEYGITENRYYIFLLAFWLTGIAIFQIIKKFNKIKVIPISLGLIALLSSFGPWSAFQISKNSQYNRMIDVLVQNNILVDNKIIKVKQKVSFEDRKDISSTIEYLVDMHGYDMFKPFFDENLDSLFVDTLYIHKPTKLLELMGLNYVNRWTNEAYYSDNFYFTSNNYSNNVTNISGYDYLIDYNSYFYSYNQNDSIYHIKFILDTNNFIVSYDTVSHSLNFFVNDSIGIKVELSGFIKDLKEQYTIDNGYNIPQEDMTKIIENDNLDIKIVFIRISGSLQDNKMTTTEILAKIFVELKFLQDKQLVYDQGVIMINI